MNRVSAALLAIASLFTQAAFPVMANDGGAKPQRIVSINLCLDQLVLMLADPEHIQSLTFLSLDPAYSFMHEEAANVRVINHGAAEEILPLEPDLVLAGQFSASFAVQVLQRTAGAIQRQQATGAALGQGPLGNQLRRQFIVEIADFHRKKSRPEAGFLACNPAQASGSLPASASAVASSATSAAGSSAGASSTGAGFGAGAFTRPSAARMLTFSSPFTALRLAS